MLHQLSISNFTLIDEITLDFSPGLNVLTGETGAGKSILIDALRLVLGERADPEVLRRKDRPSVIESVFSKDGWTPERAAALGLESKEGDDQIIFRREILPEGRSRNVFNQQSVNLSSLKDAGRWLVDFHGQYDQQHIFSRDTHRELADRLATADAEGYGQLLSSYRQKYRRYDELLKSREGLEEALAAREREMDLLKFQVQEIGQAKPAAGEDIELEKERTRLRHAQKLFEWTGRILTLLDEGDPSASSLMAEAVREFTPWIKIDESATGMKDQLENLQAALEDLRRTVQDYHDGLSFEPDRLAQIEERLECLDTLKRKYGASLEGVLSFMEEASKKLERLQNADNEQRDTGREMDALKPELERLAGEISEGRKAACRSLAKHVQAELGDLGFTRAWFECRIEPEDLGPHGNDRVEFLFSPNPGQELKPLADVVSAGEASRIILALKRALAEVDEIPVLVFDEIDANIGGRLGEIVGRKLKEIAKNRQVLLITHLPQIASFADRHIKVVKRVEGDQTFVEYKIISGDERVSELAQMMSGQRETEISRTHAREMLKAASRKG
jgi:DNA repair protein RecN (Recombination protein N)